jgi:hypothetical protein
VLDFDCAKRLQELEDSKKQVYLKYLQGVNCILRDAETQERFRDIRAIEMVLRILPSWPPPGEKWQYKELQLEKRLFIEKCELVVNCLRLGWKIHGAAFHELALRLMKHFDARPLNGKGGIIDIVGEKDSRFICIAQFLALIKVWVAMGSEVVVPMEWQTKLFRRKYEVQCFCDGVKFQMELRQEIGERTERIRKKEIADDDARVRFLDHVDYQMMYTDKAQDDDVFPARLKLATNSNKADFLDEVLNCTRLRAVSVTKIKGIESVTATVTTLSELQRELKAINFKESEKCSVKLVGLKEVESLSKTPFRNAMKRRDFRLTETVMLQYCNAVYQADLQEVLENDQGEASKDGFFSRASKSNDEEIQQALQDVSKCKETLVTNCLDVLTQYDEHMEVLRKYEVDPRSAVAYGRFREDMKAAKAGTGEMPQQEDVRTKKRDNLDKLHDFEEVYEGFKIFLRNVTRHFGASRDIDIDVDDEVELEGVPSADFEAFRANAQQSAEPEVDLWSREIQEKCKGMHTTWKQNYKDLREAVTEYWGDQEETISSHAKKIETRALKEKAEAKDEQAEAKRKMDEALQLLQDAETAQRIEEDLRKKAEEKIVAAEEKVREAKKAQNMAKLEKENAQQALEAVNQ